IDDGERIELTFRDFDDLTEAGEEILDAFPMRTRQSSGKGHRRKAAPAAAKRARHGAGPLLGWADQFAQHAQRHTCGQAYREQWPIDAPDSVEIGRASCRE